MEDLTFQCKEFFLLHVPIRTLVDPLVIYLERQQDLRYWFLSSSMRKISLAGGMIRKKKPAGTNEYEQISSFLAQ